jgi:sterol desaturase/sphingolipid hydroxylase (fatty acid hydroxylase superfamily)
MKFIWILFFEVCSPAVYLLYSWALMWYEDKYRPSLFFPPQLQPDNKEISNRVEKTVLCGLTVLSAFIGAVLCNDTIFDSVLYTVFCLAACALLAEVLFYTCHRLLHTKLLYGSVHSLHHQIKSPIGMAALYASPLEVVFGNVLPLAAPLFLLRPALLTCCLWLVVATIGTCSDHANFKLPWWPERMGIAHSLHHRVGTGNFSFLGLCDWLCGTRIRTRLS